MMTRVLPVCFAVLAGGLITVTLGAGAHQPSEKKESAAPAGSSSPKTDDKKTEAPAKQELVFVQLRTSKGDVLLELNATKAPLSVANFMKYVEKGHYDGTVFHRVINGFMIQGGGFDGSMKQKPTEAAIKNEWKNGLKNERYTVAMARLGRQPDSATSQFFINVADNAFLDQPRDGAGYAVFGKVVAGFDVVEKIKVVSTGVKATDGGQMTDVPVEPVSITSAKRVSEEEAGKIKSGGGGASAPGNGGAAAKPAEKTNEKPGEKPAAR